MRSRGSSRLLLIGPPPYREGGARVSFDIMRDYLGSFPHLAVESFDLPVHHPLYDDNGSAGPLSHRRTVMGLLRALTRVPRADTVLFFGSSDVCFSYGLAFVLCAKLFRRRCVARMTGGRAVFRTKRLPAPVRAACVAMFRAVDAFLVETEVARTDLPPKVKAKTAVMRNFRPRLPVAPPVPRDGSMTSFAFVARSDAWTTELREKGLDVLLDAFDRVCSAPGAARRIEVHLYGPIPIHMVERVRRTPGVFAYGYLSNDRLQAALQRHDVLAFPSRAWSEGHPGAIIEALIAGLPVIASDLPGPSEIVEDGVNGIIVKTGDAEAFAAAMTRLAADHELRRRLADGARESADGFDQERILPELVEALGLLPADAGPA